MRAAAARSAPFATRGACATCSASRTTRSNFREVFEREVVDPVRRRVRGRAHAEPVHRLQRPASSSPTCSPRSALRARTSWPPGTTRASSRDARRRAVAGPRARPGQGPELLPLPPDAPTAGAHAVPGRRAAQVRGARRRRAPRPARRREAREPGDLLRRGGGARVGGWRAAPGGARARRDRRPSTARSSGGTTGSRTTPSASARDSVSRQREPLYVVRIDAAPDRVVVGPRERAAGHASWSPTTSCGTARAEEPVSAVVRYRMAPVDAVARFDGDALAVEFDDPLEGVAPGQAVVCYRGDIGIGGGTIACAS